MAKVYIGTYGCTLNQSDTDIMRALIPGNGHRLVEQEADADVIILNTCTVKGATENKILERIRKLAAGNRKLVVAGCLSANIRKIRRYCPFAPIVAPSSVQFIASAVDDALDGRPMVYARPEAKDSLPRVFTAPVCRIPINEGCVSSCHFCQTKLARPFLRSNSPKSVVKWINESVKGGAREIQLTSQDSGAYGLDIRTSLSALLDAIRLDDSSTRREEGFLIRLGMINPEHAKRMLPHLVKALAGPRFYKFLHVPVQTGSEKVCREMNRDHTVRDFSDIVRSVRENLPDATIATDIIVGYPTETEDDFQQTLELLRNTKPETINLSKFSSRPGTVAKAMKQLPNAVIKRRSGEASSVVKEMTAAARKRYIGRKMRVLVTEKAKDFKGRAINYHQVVLKGFRGRLGDFVDAEIYDANHGSLFGVPAGQATKKGEEVFV